MDDSTLGGYVDKHRRPPAFDGSDGNPYSAEIYVDEEPCEDGRYGAAVLFVRWSVDGSATTGHLETEYLGFGATPDDAGLSLRCLTMYQLKDHLERLIGARKEVPDW
jgi:hypothetical protein